MKKIIALIVCCMACMSFTSCTIQKFSEKCVAVDSHTFRTSDGNLFAVDDNLMVGESYIVTFMSYDSSTRIDDIICDYVDLELYEISKYLDK